MQAIGNVCVLYVCFFNVIIFCCRWEPKRYLGLWVKILEFTGMLFIYLKVTSNVSAPEYPIIHF